MRAVRFNLGLIFLIVFAALMVIPGPAEADEKDKPRVPGGMNQSFLGEPEQDDDSCGVDNPCGPEENQGGVSKMPSVEEGVPSGDVKAAPAPVPEETVCLHFWYTKGCPHCRRVKKFLYEVKADKYPSVEIREHNANDEADLYTSLLSYYKVPESKCGRVPFVFIGDYYCFGESGCFERLDSRIAGYVSSGCECVNPGKRSALKVGIVGIASLAAVDAVNVCALAVLVILITAVLTRFPGNRKKMLRIAFAFMGGIFSAYFIVGVLIVLGFKSLSGIGSLSTSWIYKCVGVIAILLGIFNLKDVLWYGGGGFKLEVPDRWRPRMKKIIESTISAPGAYMVGLIVSTFLLPCALGPYFIASGLLSGISVAYAIPWLVLYNIVFILPMMIITLAVYGGFAAIKNIEEWRQKNIRKLHLVAGVILCAVGAAIVGGLI